MVERSKDHSCILFYFLCHYLNVQSYELCLLKKLSTSFYSFLKYVLSSKVFVCLSIFKLLFAYLFFLNLEEHQNTFLIVEILLKTVKNQLK